MTELLWALLLTAEASAAVTVEPEAAVVSRYLWRGITFVDVPVLQPGITLYPGDSGAYLGVWSSIPLVDREEWAEVDEVDPYVGWYGEGVFDEDAGQDGLGWWLDACIFAYTLPRLPADDSTAELQLRAGLDHWLGPNLVFAQDLRFWGAGTYLSLGLNPTVAPSESTELGLSLLSGASTYDGLRAQIAGGGLTAAASLGAVTFTLEGRLQWSPDSLDAKGLSPAIGLHALGSF